ncbi:MAG: YeeE/YedE family protein [Myxococcales bacterium]|nr:YeeE/YedE family protein [Myxococcales bacterium]
MRSQLTAFAAGLLFAVGLAVAGMTQPSKVIAFLDFTGDWDPSLAFVMLGAILVYAPLFRRACRMSAPYCDVSFSLPSRRDIDARLVVGAAMFGIGWGLAGYCPGPAITSIGARMPSAMLFTAAMFVGFGVHAFATRRARA